MFTVGCWTTQHECETTNAKYVQEIVSVVEQTGMDLEEGLHNCNTGKQMVKNELRAIPNKLDRVRGLAFVELPSKMGPFCPPPKCILNRGSSYL